MSERTTIVAANNVSNGWAALLDRVVAAPGQTLGPVVLEIDCADGVVAEDRFIRHIVEEELQRLGKFSVDTTSFLIFPWKLWLKLGRPDLRKFSEFYRSQVYPRLLSRDRNRNGRGTYFQRMIQFSGIVEKSDGREEKNVNQLERVLEIWEKAEDKGRHPRHSALQATIFDPAKDHHGMALCGFPCLQQVSFDYHGDQLTVNAYYPTQYLFDRGYGNYLGLCHLGQFMAAQMDLRFAALICFIGRCHLGTKVTKSSLVSLQNRIHVHLGKTPLATTPGAMAPVGGRA